MLRACNVGPLVIYTAFSGYSSAMSTDAQQPDEETERLIADALGTYSADGQVDDATGGDAGAEEKYGHEAHPRGERPQASPEGPRTGPA